MFNSQPSRLSASSSGFDESAIARAKAAKAATGLYVSRVLLVSGVCGDIRTFVKQAETANRLGCSAILQVGSFGFQSHRLEGEAYLDQVEKYARRFGVAVVWTPGEDDNLNLLARIPGDSDGLITLRSRIRCAPDGSSWLWGDARFGTVNDTAIPGRKAKSHSALSDLDILVVRGSLVGSDVVVSPKLRVVIYGSPGHRLVSGALPRTGTVVEWTEQTVVDLTTFSFTGDGRANRRPEASESDDFEVGLSYLRQYALDNKDTFVTRSYVTDDGFRLGRWIALVRSSYESGRLDPAKSSAVETVPHWQWDPYEPMARTADRSESKAHGEPANALVPLSSLPQPAGIAADPTSPASSSSGRLPRPLPFEAWLAQLEKFTADQGHARPSKSYIDSDGFRLGRWVSHLREAGRRARLTADETAALEALAGWSWGSKPKPAAPAPAVTYRWDRPDALGGPVGAPLS